MIGVHYAVFERATGRIKWAGVCHPEDFAAQATGLDDGLIQSTSTIDPNAWKVNLATFELEPL